MEYTEIDETTGCITHKPIMPQPEIQSDLSKRWSVPGDLPRKVLTRVVCNRCDHQFDWMRFEDMPEDNLAVCPECKEWTEICEVSGGTILKPHTPLSESLRNLSTDDLHYIKEHMERNYDIPKLPVGYKYWYRDENGVIHERTVGD